VPEPRAPLVLVVDDDEAVIDYLRASFGARYDIASTSAPENVLALAREVAPSLILCDIDMPGMDGGDVSKALYGEAGLREIPLLFITGLVSADDLKGSSPQIGGRPAISKHAPLEALLKKVESLTR